MRSSKSSYWADMNVGKLLYQQQSELFLIITNSDNINKHLCYINFICPIQMQLRVPNQYKPTCLDNLLSVFLPMPTHRILSDKKILRQKKINLSLADDKKSKTSRKLTVSSSFHSKNTPATHQPNNSHPINKDQPLFYHDNYAFSRGLNFHPRRISFHNEDMRKSNIKMQAEYPSYSLPLKPDSRKPLLLDRKNQHQRVSPMHKIKDTKPPTFFKQQKSLYDQKQQSKKFNQNPQFEKNFPLSVMLPNFKQKQVSNKVQISQKYNLNMEGEKKNFKTQQAAQTMKKSQSLEIQLDSSKKQKSRLSGYQLNEKSFQQVKRKTMNLLETPKNTRKNRSMNKNQYFTNNFKPNNMSKNLYERALTIESKNDQSSQREQSVCYSNVIERLKPEDLLFKMHQNRNKEALRGKSLNENLEQNFQQNNLLYNRGSQKIMTMNFKKKKYQTQGISDRKVYEKEDNYKYLEDLFINNNFNRFIESSVSEENKEKKEKKSENVYDQFPKINYLGVGRFASVYLCSISSINFIFAMKQILKFTVKFNNLQNQLRKQIQIQYSCKHPHIIGLFHAWNDDKKYYLALEYGQQTLLNRIQKRDAVKEDDCIIYIKQVAKGLQYLHRNGVVHRDIKPENVMLVNGTCKIGDFGWAATIQSGTLNEACGTPCYLSPQMEKMQNYTVKTDCWSLGILAYELINGKLDQSYFGRQGIKRQKLQYNNKVSSEYKKIIFSLLAEEEKDRPSINQLLSWQIFKQN